MKEDPFDNPARNAGVLRNLVHNFQVIHVTGWLQAVTLEEAVAAWQQVHTPVKIKPKLRVNALLTSS